MPRAVFNATEELPGDPLRALVLAMVSERDAAITARDAAAVERDTAVAERDVLAVRNERLHALLLNLRRMQFGRKSDRLPAEQLALSLEELETSVVQIEAEAEQDDPGLRRERG